MSVAAIRREIALIEDHGAFHVDDAHILVSPGVVGKHCSAAEHALLSAFKRRLDARTIPSMRAAREVLASKIAQGPSTLGEYAGSAIKGSLLFGLGFGLIGIAAGVTLGALGPNGGWRDLAMIATGSLGGGIGAAVGVGVGTLRAIRD